MVSTLLFGVAVLLSGHGLQSFGPQSFFLFIAALLVLGTGAKLFFLYSRASDLENFNEFNLATTASAQGAIQMHPRAEDEAL